MNNREVWGEVWGVWVEFPYAPEKTGWYGDGTDEGVRAFRNSNDALEFAASRRQQYPGLNCTAQRITRITQEVEVKVEVPVPPSADALARAIFNTDERVKKDISKYAGECDCEFCRQNGVSPTSVLLSPDAICREMAPYFDKAWDSNRNNWRTEAEAKAAELLAELDRLGK